MIHSLLSIARAYPALDGEGRQLPPD